LTHQHGIGVLLADGKRSFGIIQLLRHPDSRRDFLPSMNAYRCLVALIFVCSIAAASEQLKRPGYRLTFEAGFEADAKRLAVATDTAIELLGAAFHDWDGRGLLESANLEIIIYAMPTRQADEATTRLNTEWRGNQYFAKLHILAPSRVSTTALTTVGEPKDERYFQQLLVHELSSIISDRVSAKKPGGWHLYSAPGWFVQGLEQYLALSLTESKSTMEKYLERSRRDPRQVQTDFGIHVMNDYIAGTALVAFLAREGLGPIKRLLLSPEPTFGKALRAEFKVDVITFGEQFQLWLHGPPEGPNK
jgi:hypothetical protein